MYLLIEQSDETVRVVGYYAINPTQIARADAPTRLARGWPTHVPAWKIGKLAIHVDLQSDKEAQWGRQLLRDALETIVRVSDAGGGKVWKDLLKYCYELGLNYFEANIVVNKEAMAKLPPQQREVLVKAIVELTPKMTETLFAEESEEKAKRKAEGMVQTDATPADYKRGAERMVSYWDEWAKPKGAETQEALKKVRDALGR